MNRPRKCWSDDLESEPGRSAAEIVADMSPSEFDRHYAGDGPAYKIDAVDEILREREGRFR